MKVNIIIPPAKLPVTLQEAKDHLRVDHNDEDSLIELYLKAACNHIERVICKRAFVIQTLELVLDSWPIYEIKLPRPPLQEVLSVKYTDADGVEHTIDPGEYIVDKDSEPGRIVPIDGWTACPLYPVNAIKIQYKAGYPPGGEGGDDLTANIPADLINAILLLTAQLYEYREPILVGSASFVNKVPFAVEALCFDHRVGIV